MKTTDTDTSKDKPQRLRSKTHTDSGDTARNTVSAFSSHRANSAGAPEAVAVFRRWIMAAVATPSLHESMLDKIARCGVKDLPEMIDAVDQAKEICMAEVQDLHRRARRQPNEVDGNCLNIIALAVAISRTGKNITWLGEVRRDLTGELEAAREAAAQ